MEFGCANEVPMQTTSLEGGPRASTTPCGFRSSPSPQVRTCPRLTLAGFRGLPVPISCSCVLRFIIREACLYGTSRALRISTHPVSRLSFTRDRPVGYGDKVPVTPLGRILATLWMVIGIVIFSILTGIMSSNFSNSACAKHAQRTGCARAAHGLRTRNARASHPASHSASPLRPTRIAYS